jgi:DNA (cytosine-5)-methyltransferase 1
MNYYNENDKFAADWLENLIEKGIIPDGKVDRRPIAEVQADDVRGFTQCHFFAGIGGWSLALQLAGWAPHRPVWTGSCPCQPFSQAGKQKANKDERHLWPEMYRLINECRPEIVFGEQVASPEVVGAQLEADFVIAIQEGEFARANKLAKRLIASKSFNATPRWVDGIRSDLETANYSLRLRVLGAFSVGAPHKRSRLFWVADSCVSKCGGWSQSAGQHRGAIHLADSGGVDGMADSAGVRGAKHVDDSRKREAGREDHSADCCRAGGVADSGCVRNHGSRDGGIETRKGVWRDQPATGRDVYAVGDAIDSGPQGFAGHVDLGNQSGWIGQDETRSTAASSPWSNYHVVDCRDGKSRRVGCGIQPLVNGIPRSLGRGKPELWRLAKRARANYKGRLKGYGNAIVPQVAAEFVMALMDCKSTNESESCTD